MSTAPHPSSRAFIALMPDLRRTARRLSQSVEDADDLVQETLLKVWARVMIAHLGHSDSAPISDLRAYAFTTLRNCARSRPAPPPRADDDEVEQIEAPADEAPAHLACSEALEALDSLPEDQASLLRLRALDGLSYSEIAAKTGLPMGTVTSRLSRGRAALRRVMGLPPDAPVTDLFRAE